MPDVLSGLQGNDRAEHMGYECETTANCNEIDSPGAVSLAADDLILKGCNSAADQWVLSLSEGNSGFRRAFIIPPAANSTNAEKTRGKIS